MNQLSGSTGQSVLASLVSGAQVVRIEIRASLWGRKGLIEEELVISGSKGKYAADGKTVETEAIEALLTALDEPRVEEPSILNCGIDQAWLVSNYEPDLQEFLRGARDGRLYEQSARQLEFFRSQFAESSVAQEAFVSLFRFWRTGGSREMKVIVTIDGNQFGVKCSSQYVFMLPWVGLDKERGGYNCHLSRAIAAILPENFCTQGILAPSAESLRWRITEAAMRIIGERWRCNFPE